MPIHRPDPPDKRVSRAYIGEAKVVDFEKLEKGKKVSKLMLSILLFSYFVIGWVSFYSYENYNEWYNNAGFEIYTWILITLFIVKEIIDSFLFNKKLFTKIILIASGAISVMSLGSVIFNMEYFAYELIYQILFFCGAVGSILMYYLEY